MPKWKSGKLYSRSLFQNPVTHRDEFCVPGRIPRDVSCSLTGKSVHPVYTRDLSVIFCTVITENCIVNKSIIMQSNNVPGLNEFPLVQAPTLDLNFDSTIASETNQTVEDTLEKKEEECLLEVRLSRI